MSIIDTPPLPCTDCGRATCGECAGCGEPVLAEARACAAAWAAFKTDRTYDNFCAWQEYDSTLTLLVQNQPEPKTAIYGIAAQLTQELAHYDH